MNKASKGSTIQPIPVTRKQLSFIFSIVEKKKLPIEKVKAIMQEMYGIVESKQLTIQQASDFIEYLKAFQLSVNEQNNELPTNK